MADPSAPSICRKTDTSSVAPNVERPIAFQSRKNRILRRLGRRIVAVDLPDVLDQAGITFGDADDGSG